MTTEKTTQSRADIVDKDTLEIWQLGSVLLSYKEIAESIGRSERTVRNAIRFGLATDNTKNLLNEYFTKRAA